MVGIAALPGFPVHAVLLWGPFLYAMSDPWLVLLPTGGTGRYVLCHGRGEVALDLLPVFIHGRFRKTCFEGTNENGGIFFHF